MCGYIDIEADNMEEAMKKFHSESGHIKLPEDGIYVDGSFQLTSDDVEEMEVMADFSSKPVHDIFSMETKTMANFLNNRERNSKVNRIFKQIQDVVRTSLEEEVWIPINRNRQIRVEIIPLTNGRTEVASTLYTAEGKEIITAVCEHYLPEMIKDNIQSLLAYAEQESPEIWAKIYARNLLYCLTEMKTTPYECNAPEWMDKKIFLLVTYDEAEEKGEEDVLTFELRTDADVLFVEHLLIKDIFEDKVADMLVCIRENYTKNTK